MADIATIFSIKLNNSDFKTRLKEAEQLSKEYQEQTARALLKAAQQDQARITLLEKKALLQASGDKAGITAINKEIAALKSLTTARNLEISNLQKAQAITRDFIKVKDDATSIMDKQAKSTENLANQTIRYLRWAGTIAGVVYAGKRAWDATLGTGIEVNKIIESNTMGIAALTSANTRMVDSLGNTLTPFEKFAMGQKVATKAVEDLRAASVKTYATFPQLLEIYQQAIGQTMSMGGAFGQTVDEVSANTIELSKTLSNIAGSIGMPMDRVREEIRSMLSGNASTDSLISTMLFGSPGEANKAIRDAKGRTNGVVDLLNDMMKDFKILETTRTYQKGILTLQDSWSRVMSGMVEKSGMFQDITDMFYNMSEGIVDNTDGIIEAFDTFYTVGSKAVGILDNIAVPATVIGSVYALSTASGVLTAGIISMTAAIRANPILSGIAIATTIGYGIYEYFDDINDKALELNKTLGLSEEKIKNLGQRQRETGIGLISEKINELTIEAGKIRYTDKKEYDNLKKEIAELSNKRIAIREVSNEYQNADKKAKEIIARGEKQASLLLTLGVDTKQLEKFKKDAESGEDKLLKLQEDKLEAQKAINKYQKEYNDNVKANTLDEEGKKTLTTAIIEAKKAEATYEKQINEEVDKRAKKQEEIERTRAKILRDEWVSAQKLAGIETKKSDDILFEIQGNSKLLEQTRDKYEIAKLNTKINKDADAYNKAIIDEEEQARKKREADEKKLEKDKRRTAKEILKDRKLEQDLEIQRINLTMIGIEKEKELAKIQAERNLANIQERFANGEQTAEYYLKLMEYEKERARLEQFNYTVTGQLIQITSKQMENSLGDFLNFASEGFLDFGNLAMDILNEILKQMIQMQVVNPLVSAGTKALTGYFSPSAALPSLTDMGVSTIPNTVTPNAKGGAYSSPSLSQYSNQVVSNPTPFYFASGGVPNLGVFGEAGSEAIMPLTRTSGGDLGVKAVGGNQNVTVKIINESGTEMQATSSSADFDINGMILTVVMDAANTNKMGFRDVMGGIR